MCPHVPHSGGKTTSPLGYGSGPYPTQEQRKPKMKVGEILRLQLDPEGLAFRYMPVKGSTWRDLGYSDHWVDSEVTKVIPVERTFVLKFVNIEGKTLVLHLPLPKHPQYPPDANILPGWPRHLAIVSRVPNCDCGCEAVYGDTGVHASWCSKAAYLNQPNR